MSEQQPKPEFQPIVETGTIRRLLFQCSQELAESTVAIEKQEYIARMKLISFDEQTADFHVLCSSEPENEALRAQLEKTGGKRCLFNVNMSQASLFFLSDVRGQDLSEGGMSFQAGLHEDGEYASNSKVALRFKLKGNIISLPGIVRHARPLKTREGQTVLKVGVEFIEPPQEARDQIARYIFDEQSRSAMR